MAVEYDPVQFRRQVTFGWVNQNHEPWLVSRVKRYLFTGDPVYLTDTRYAKIREGLLK